MPKVCKTSFSDSFWWRCRSCSSSSTWSTGSATAATSSSSRRALKTRSRFTEIFPVSSEHISSSNSFKNLSSVHRTSGKKLSILKCVNESNVCFQLFFRFFDFSIFKTKLSKTNLNLPKKSHKRKTAKAKTSAWLRFKKKLKLFSSTHFFRFVRHRHQRSAA